MYLIVSFIWIYYCPWDLNESIYDISELPQMES